MPELPEVETIVRGLQAALPGRSLVGVRLGKTDFIDDPSALAELLPGTRISRVERFGKFIHVEAESCPGLSKPNGRLHLVLHLGMSGRLSVQSAGDPVVPHTHAFFELDDGRELRYTDSRRFGRIVVLFDQDIALFRARLGAEPLQISPAQFRHRLAGRRARIKALLLDQHVLCGVGNIYADESLWLARIHPARQAARLGSSDLDRLRLALRRVLREAIRLRGSSISDYLDAEGNPGAYQQRHRVYHRHGQPCFRCGTTLRRILVAGRGSHFCPRCQPPPRPMRVSAGKRKPEAQRKQHGRRRSAIAPPGTRASEPRKGFA